MTWCQTTFREGDTRPGGRLPVGRAALSVAFAGDVHVPLAVVSATIFTRPLEKISQRVLAGEKDMAGWVVLPRTLTGQPRRKRSVDRQVRRVTEPAQSALVVGESTRRCQRRRKEHP